MTALERAWRGGRSEWKTHLTSALCSTLAFLCLAFALLAVVNLKALQQRWENSGRMSVYVMPSASEPQVQELIDALRRSALVARADFVSADVARSEITRVTGSNLLQALPTEAFSASVEIVLRPTASRADLQGLMNSLNRMTTLVESIETYDGWTRRIARLVGASVLAASLLAGIVFIAVAAVVASATTLALQRRRDEVEVMRIVGATSHYVRQPFLIEGATQGALGAVAALFLAATAFNLLGSHFDDQFTLLFGTRPSFLPWPLGFGMIVIGAGLGSLAALLSLRRSFSA